MTIKFKEGAFDSFFIFAKKKVDNATKRGMHKAVKTWKFDALETVPKVPVRSGWLKRHHRTKVKRGIDLIGILETYDTPYAATIHSGISKSKTPIHYKNPDQGAHWLSAKLYQNAERYFRIIEKEI